MGQGMGMKTQVSPCPTQHGFLHPQPEITISGRAGQEQRKNDEQRWKNTVQGKVKWVSGDNDQVRLVHAHPNAAKSVFFFSPVMHIVVQFSIDLAAAQAFLAITNILSAAQHQISAMASLH